MIPNNGPNVFLNIDELFIQMALDGMDDVLFPRFREIRSRAQRIKYIEKLLIHHNLIGDKKNFTYDKSSPKAIAIAEISRECGNRNFKRKDYWEAVKWYNQCLGFAYLGSKQEADAYASRAEVCFELRFLGECLKNIEWAEACNVTKEKLAALEKRKKLVLEMIANGEGFNNPMYAIGHQFLGLNMDTSENYPMADCFEVKTDKAFGRHVITNKKLRVGDIFCIDEPFSKILFAEYGCEFCAYCLSNNALDLIPCKICTHVMFCSDQGSKSCAKMGYEKFHKYECGLITGLHNTGEIEWRAAFNTFLEGFYACNQNLREFKRVAAENCDSKKTIFDFDDLSDRRNLFRIIDAIPKTKKGNTFDDFKICAKTAIITHLFMKHSPLKEVLKSEDDQEFFRLCIYKYSQQCGYSRVSHSSLKGDELNFLPYHAIGTYPFFSLVNHSCAANIIRVNYGSKSIGVVIRPIQPGEQIFLNYQVNHDLYDYAYRRNFLMKNFSFICKCEACTFNYGQSRDLSLVDMRLTNSILYSDRPHLIKASFDLAKSKYRHYFKILQMIDNEYPTLDISCVRECVSRCFAIFALPLCRYRSMINQSE